MIWIKSKLSKHEREAWLQMWKDVRRLGAIAGKEPVFYKPPITQQFCEYVEQHVTEAGLTEDETMQVLEEMGETLTRYLENR